MIDLQETINQLGGKGFNGALVYTGVSEIAIVDKSNEQNDGCIGFKVNGKKGYKWIITIALDWNDTYTVTLIQLRGKDKQYLDVKNNVYCDELQDVFETMYDNAIKKHCGGFIHI